MSPNTTERGAGRPHLLFFRWFRPDLPTFLRLQLEEQERCLAHFFDVTVVREDCDYDEMCDRHQPDLVVVESGVYVGRRSITHIETHPDIPKLGFLHADAFDTSRATFVSDMARWGIESYFTTSVSMAEYTPEIADALFVWPNAVDTAIFRDYGNPKVIPVLLTGSQATHYPWRNAVARAVSQTYPTMACPHFGWNGEVGSERLAVGSEYARLINSALFAPACGTIAKDVVRKHLEIPAARTCLVAERTPALESFGFEDMVNCVFADEDDVVEKIDHLLHDRLRLGQLTDAGHELVHRRHSLGSRRQVLDWFELDRQRTGSQRIVQARADGPLVLTSAPPSRESVRLSSAGRDRVLIAQGWAQVRAGAVPKAERAFRRCLNYFLIPEAVVGLSHCQLLSGDARGAVKSLQGVIQVNLTYQHGHDPDPVQWAYYVRALLCCGSLAQAINEATRFQNVRHPELDRLRHVLCVAAGVPDPSAEQLASQPVRATTTPVPPVAPREWRSDLRQMLMACGQDALASQLLQHEDTTVGTNATGAGWRSQPHAVTHRPGSTGLTRLWRQLRANPPSQLLGRVEERGRRILRPVRRSLVEDDWSRYVYGLVKAEDAATALVVGHSPLSRGERGFCAGLDANPELPVLRRLRTPPGRRVGEALARRSAAASSEDARDERTADLVYVTTSGGRLLPDPGSLHQATLIFLEGLDQACVQALYRGLLDEHGYQLLTVDPHENRGRAALRRVGGVAAAPKEDYGGRDRGSSR